MATTASARTDYAQAVDELADRVLRALRGRQDAGLLAEHVDHAPDTTAALAAVRVLGADALAAHLLRRMPLTPPEVEVVRESLRLFPLPTGTDDPHTGAVTAWRDWALGQVGLRCHADLPAVPAPRDAVPADAGAWKPWSVRMAQLSVLAVPGLDGPVHHAARGNPIALASGATRAVLRRDHPTAAALGRWLALLQVQGEPVLDLALLAEHVGLLGGSEARTALDVGITQGVLQGASR